MNRGSARTRPRIRRVPVLATMMLASSLPWSTLEGAEPVAAPPAATEGRRLPAFSWDRVPCYMHVRKDTAFTDAEVRYLASFPLVTFEKGTGAKDAGSTEAGTLAAARSIKAVNPATRILYYRNVLVHYGGYDGNAALASIPHPFLVDRDGRDKLIRNRVEAYDLANGRVRDWWLAQARRVCGDPAIDGLFVDGNVKVLEPGYLRGEIGEEKKAAVAEGYAVLMKDVRRTLGPEKLMLANVLRARFPDAGMDALRAFDGSYIEGFETVVGGGDPREYVARGLVAVQEAARQGFLIAFTAGLGTEETDEPRNRQRTDEIRRPAAEGGDASAQRFAYLLAMFLVCAGERSYFCAHDGYDAKTSSVWMKRPPELDRPLGPPKGPAVRTGWVYTRAFAHANVRLDLEQRTGFIVWTAP